MNRKLESLHALLRSFGSVAIGCSGGVDSTFLAAVCQRIMPDRTLLVHLSTPLIGSPEQQSFEDMIEGRGASKCVGTGHHRSDRAVCRESALSLPVVQIALDPLANPDVTRNDERRCYHCKLAGFSCIAREARDRGFAVVLDGSNADDAGDFRPGMQAIVELGVRSPLMETGWRKDEERELLRAWSYPVWNLPAGACLATRVATSEPLSAEKLDQVRICEDLLYERGLRQVRARLGGGLMRIEAAPVDLDRLGGRAETAAGDRAEPDGVDAATTEADAGIVALPEDLLKRLRSLLDVRLDPFAHPYRKGDMNAASGAVATHAPSETERRKTRPESPRT